MRSFECGLFFYGHARWTHFGQVSLKQAHEKDDCQTCMVIAAVFSIPEVERPLLVRCAHGILLVWAGGEGDYFIGFTAVSFFFFLHLTAAVTSHYPKMSLDLIADCRTPQLRASWSASSISLQKHAIAGTVAYFYLIPGGF